MIRLKRRLANFKKIKNKGSITIYLSLIIVSVMLFVSVISESARIKAVQAKSQGFTDMATESIIAGYAKQMYEDYGVLLVWENQPVIEQLKKYIQANINMADLGMQGTNFMNTHLTNVEIIKKGYVTDNGGEQFVQQIISYMKYAGVVKAADKLIQKYNVSKYSGNSRKPINKDVTDIVDSVEYELGEIVSNINKNIADIKDTNEFEKKVFAASQSLKKLNSTGITKNTEKRYTKSFLQKYRKLITIFDKEAGNVNSTIVLIKKYESKKEQLLKKNGYTSGERDYIEDNLKVLEKVENKIKEIKVLKVSDFSKIDSENINIINESIEKIQDIIESLKCLNIRKASNEDVKCLSVIENAKAFFENGILSLVVKNISDISNLSIPDSNLPSNLKEQKSQGMFLENIKNKAILAIYMNIKFGNYLNSKKDNSLIYEMEYIINGKSNDKENLKNAVEKIVAIRNVFNFAYLISDGKKMNEISTIAASAALAVGIPFLESVFKVFMTEVWALAESINDTRNLLNGACVPIIKSASNWKTDLKNLYNESSNISKDNEGLDYIEYLQILLMGDKSQSYIYRMLDLMQQNMQKKYNPKFLIKECFQSLEVRAEFETEPLFTTIPLVVNGITERNNSYRYDMICEKGY